MPASDAGLRTASDSDRMPDRGQILIRDGTFAEQSACRIVRALTCPGTLNNKNLIRSATICRLWAVHGGCLFLRQIFPDPLQKCKNTFRVPRKNTFLFSDICVIMAVAYVLRNHAGDAKT